MRIWRNEPHKRIYAITPIKLLMMLIVDVALASHLGTRARVIPINVLWPGSESDTSQRIRCINVTKNPTQHIIIMLGTSPASYIVRGIAKNPAHITQPLKRRKPDRNHDCLLCIVFLLG